MCLKFGKLGEIGICLLYGFIGDRKLDPLFIAVQYLHIEWLMFPKVDSFSSLLGPVFLLKFLTAYCFS